MSLQLQMNVAQLLKEAVGATRTFAIDGPELESDDGAPAYVRGTLRLTRTDQGIWAFGDVTFTVDYICSRCLAKVTSWGESRVDDVFLPVWTSQPERNSDTIMTTPTRM